MSRIDKPEKLPEQYLILRQTYLPDEIVEIGKLSGHLSFFLFSSKVSLREFHFKRVTPECAARSSATDPVSPCACRTPIAD